MHTVQFSNHTGYGQWQGRVFDADMIREVVGGIEQGDVLGECDGVLSGYIGGADIGAAILDAVATVKRANPSAKYCCDPVIGDVGRGIFVARGVPEFMKQKAVPAAEVITPNHFELDYLSGRDSKTLAQARDAVKAVHDLGPGVIMVTSLRTQETPENAIDLLASNGDSCFRLRTPLLPLVANGAGDAIAALFFAHYLREGKIDVALSRAASAIFGVLAKTVEAGAPEIQLIAAQDELVKPTQVVRGGRHHAHEPSARADPRRPAGADLRAQALGLRRRAAGGNRRLFCARSSAKSRRYGTAACCCCTHQVVRDGVFRGDYLETDYASFAAWSAWGRPPAGVHDCFGAAAMQAADGAFLLGVMGRQTFQRRADLFSLRHARSRRHCGGKVDLARSVRARTQGRDRA